MRERSVFHKCWTSQLLDQYFTTEAMSKERSAFLEVHLPIDKIRVDRRYPAFSDLQGKEYIGEDRLLDLVTNSTPAQANRIFVLVGETGSGKSELCQWLHYRIDNSVHVPILISRSMIRLRDIVTEINKHLGEELPSDLRDITDLWPETISKTLVAAMYRRLERPEVQNRIHSKDAGKLRSLMDEKSFEQQMRDNFVDYRDEIRRLDKPRDLNLLPEKDFLALVKEISGLHEPGVCYRELQQAIIDCLASELRVEDLIDKLSRIAQKYKKQKRRPVLLIEDITTWGFLQNDLLDYLFDLSRGNYDVVIGVTTGFERTNQDQIYKSQQTITERLQGRFELTDERRGETVFMRDHFVDLARLYLKAVKGKASCESCQLGNECHEVFGKYLYPFNREFLANVYNNLQQDGNPKRTPRLLLRALRHCLEAEIPPFESIELLNYVGQPTAYFKRSSLSPAAEALFKWYGTNTNQGVLLPVAVAKIFNSHPPQNIEQVNGYYHLPLRAGMEGLLPDPEKSLDTSHKKEVIEIEADTDPDLNLKPQKKSEEKKVEPSTIADKSDEKITIDAFGEMDQWLQLQGNFPQRETFKDGVWKLIDFFEFAPFELKHQHCIARGAKPLLFNRGSKRARIYLHQSADSKQPGYFKLTIEPDRTQEDLFNQILALGLARYDVTDRGKLDHVHLYDWLNDQVVELRNQMSQSLSSALGIPMEDFILLSKFLLLNSCEGLTDLDPLHLSKPIEGEPLQLPGLGRYGEHLYECRQHIDALFIAFFHLRNNLIDFPLLDRTTRKIRPTEALTTLGSISPAEVPKGFQITIDDDTLTLRGLARVIRDYSGYLRRVQQKDRFMLKPTTETLQSIHQLCDPPDNLTGNGLREQVGKLHHLTRILNIRWQRQWDLQLICLDKQPENLDFPKFFDALSTTMNKVRCLEADPNAFTYLATQRAVNRITRTSEYEVIQGLRTVLQGIRKILSNHIDTSRWSQEFRGFERAFQQYQKKVNQ